jgi:hypothetical protein
MGESDDADSCGCGTKKYQELRSRNRAGGLALNAIGAMAFDKEMKA